MRPTPQSHQTLTGFPVKNREEVVNNFVPVHTYLIWFYLEVVVNATQNVLEVVNVGVSEAVSIITLFDFIELLELFLIRT